MFSYFKNAKVLSLHQSEKPNLGLHYDYTIEENGKDKTICSETQHILFFALVENDNKTGIYPIINLESENAVKLGLNPGLVPIPVGDERLFTMIDDYNVIETRLFDLTEQEKLFEESIYKME